MSVTPKHFLDLHTFDLTELKKILATARDLKAKQKQRIAHPLLAGRTLAMIFEKPSTRTRVSFEVGIQQLGGASVILDTNSSQLGRGETIADTARVLSRFVDLMMIRCHSHQSLLELAEYSTVPVINGLTCHSHPCQIMADIMTYEEHRGDIAGKVVAWLGDGNNVCASWIHAAVKFGFELRVATPTKYKPELEVLKWAREKNGHVILFDDPKEAIRGADCVVTDTWVSMGDSEDEVEERHRLLEPYQVNERLLAQADPNAIFMHCLPAHRGEEVTEGVIDGPQSVVMDEAENRLHVQKAIMLYVICE